MTLTLAPLRGVTVATFRRVFVRHFGGFSAAVAPFIPTVAGERVRFALLRDIAEPDSELPMRLVPQIIGKEPAHMPAMASAFRELGFTECNLNCGCPWKFVAKKGRGAGLMKDADSLRRMLEAGCAAFPGGFSVKVRLGVDTKDLLARRMEIFNEFPLAYVVIHPRTAVQMYEGEVDLDAFAEAAALCRHPVHYNGDIRTPEDALRLKDRFPAVSAWMIGRGAVSDPFLPWKIRKRLGAADENGSNFRQTKTESSGSVRWKRLKDFHDDLYESYRSELSGPAPVLGRMKEFWGYFAVNFRNSEHVLKSVQRSPSLLAYDAAVHRAFEEG